MNKTELINIIREELGEKATKQCAVKALNATIKTVTKEKVQIAGFGTFETKTRAARKGRTPRTGETIQIPASKSVSFKPSGTLQS